MPAPSLLRFAARPDAQPGPLALTGGPMPSPARPIFRRPVEPAARPDAQPGGPLALTGGPMPSPARSP